MLDILSSPLRGYIAQTLQYYLSKYIEGIQLEGLGIFGGDLVLNDLEIKRDVLQKSLEIPSSFDFSRGFIRELRIHIPWTQLLSQPIEVKLYTIELILTAQRESDRRYSRRASYTSSIENPVSPHKSSVDPGASSSEQKMDEPKSGWLHDTMHKILANITIQINNLVLKYEQNDVVLSVALGVLEMFSVNEEKGWVKSYEEPKGTSSIICKRIDAKDITIFLDRYTSDRKLSSSIDTSEVHRRVVGYEVPVLNRTSISVRVKYAMKAKAGQSATMYGMGLDQNSLPSDQIKGIRHPDLVSITDPNANQHIYNASAYLDPFFDYSKKRSFVIPTIELDILVKELAFSLSDRQLIMIQEMLMTQAELKDSTILVPLGGTPAPLNSQPVILNTSSTDARPSPSQMGQKENASSASSGGWFGWAMNMLGGAENDEDDSLVSEIIAETKGEIELLRQEVVKITGSSDEVIQQSRQEGATTKATSSLTCIRLCVNSALLTLRRHPEESTVEKLSKDKPIEKEIEEEELVPVANMGMVKVSTRHNSQARISKPAIPICILVLSTSLVEVLISSIPNFEKQLTENSSKRLKKTDILFEIEEIHLDTVFKDGQRRSQDGGSVLSWGTSTPATPKEDIIKHTYYDHTFYVEEARRLDIQKRKSSTFDLIKIDASSGTIPVWKTQKDSDDRQNANQFSCDCSVDYLDISRPCIDLNYLSQLSSCILQDIDVNQLWESEYLYKLIDLIQATLSRDFEGVMINKKKMCHTIKWLLRELYGDNNSDQSTKSKNRFLSALFVVLAREMFHTCSNTRYLAGPSGVIRRSYSALRMHYCSTSVFELSHKFSNETVEGSRDHVRMSPRGSPQVAIVKDFEEKVIDQRTLTDIILGRVSLNLSFNDTRDIWGLISLAIPTWESSPRDENIRDDEITHFIPSTELLITAEGCEINIGSVEKSHLNAKINRVLWHNTRNGSGSNPSLSQSTETNWEWISFDSLNASLVESHQKHNVFSAIGPTLTREFSEQSLGIDIILEKLMASTACSHIEFILNSWEQLISCFSSVQYDKFLDFNKHSSGEKAFVAELLGVYGSLTARSVNIDGMSASSVDILGTIKSVDLSVVSLLSVARKPVFSTHTSKLKSCRADKPFIPSTPFLAISLSHVVPLEVAGNYPVIGSIFHKPFRSQVDTLLLWKKIQCTLELDVGDFELFWDRVVKAHNIFNNVSCSSSSSDPPMNDLDNTTSTSPMLDIFLMNYKWSIEIRCELSTGIIMLMPHLELRTPTIRLISSASPHERSSLPSSISSLNNPGSLTDFGNARLILECSEFQLQTSTRSPVLVVGSTTGTFDIRLNGHNNEKHFFIGTDISFLVRSVQISLSRLKLNWLNGIRPLQRQQKQQGQQEQQEDHSSPHSTSSIFWAVKCGAQLDSLITQCDGKVMKYPTSFQDLLDVSINGTFSDIYGALRIANYRPIRHVYQEHNIERSSSVDVQFYLQDASILEEVRPHRSIGQIAISQRSRFGSLISLSKHNLLGILLCLQVEELKIVAHAFHFQSLKDKIEGKLSSPMVAWQLTTWIAKLFVKIQDRLKKKNDHNERKDAHVIKKLPVLVTSSILSSSTTTVRLSKGPFLSIFFRNYALIKSVSPNLVDCSPLRVFAITLQDFDIVLSPRMVCCISYLASPSRLNHHKQDDGNDVVKMKPTTRSEMPRDMNCLQISLEVGQTRLLLPSGESELIHLSKEKMGACPIQQDAFVLLLESVTLSSATWNEQNFDVLSSFPFNVTILPRVGSTTIFSMKGSKDTEKNRKISCRSGNISAYLAKIVTAVSSPTGQENSVGRKASTPFEDMLSNSLGKLTELQLVENLILPFVFSFEYGLMRLSTEPIIEYVNLNITKVIIAVSKSSFDRIHGKIFQLQASIGSIKSKKRSRENPSHREASFRPQSSPTTPLLLEILTEGIEVNVMNEERSIHLRVAQVELIHDFHTMKGSFSIQNLVVGHRNRCYTNDVEKHMQGNEQHIRVKEEVVFGPLSDPSQWQWNVEKHKELLISCRWTLPQKEFAGTGLLEVQAFQIHVSVKLLETLIDYMQCEETVLFSSGYEYEENENNEETFAQIEELDSQLVASDEFTFTGKMVTKILIGRTVISFWEYLPMQNQSTRVWISFGELFGSLTCGSDLYQEEQLMSSYNSLGDDSSVNNLFRYHRVQVLHYVVNVERAASKASCYSPVLYVCHDPSTSYGSLTRECVESTWRNFIFHIDRESHEKLELLPEYSWSLNGEMDQVLELTHGGIKKKNLSTFSVHLEIYNGLIIRVSSWTVGAILHLSEAITQWRQRMSEKVSTSTEEDRVNATKTKFKAKSLQTKPRCSSLDSDTSIDDLNALRRVAEARHPTAGELVFEDSLVVETVNRFDDHKEGASKATRALAVVPNIDGNDEITHLIDIHHQVAQVNTPWWIDPAEEVGQSPKHTSQTNGWMVMRWKYHLSREITGIDVFPVPIPPSGIPYGWPVWNKNATQDINVVEDKNEGSPLTDNYNVFDMKQDERLCDILCELRCWSEKQQEFALVSRFFVPWENEKVLSSIARTNDEKNGSDVLGITDFINQWFESETSDESEKAKLKLYQILCLPRKISFVGQRQYSSDKWELRWRNPMTSGSSDKESCNARLLINTLLASSLRVQSRLALHHFPCKSASISVQEVTVALSHVNQSDHIHDLLAVQFQNTEVTLHQISTTLVMKLEINLNTTFHLQMENVVQLVTVSIVPPVSWNSNICYVYDSTDSQLQIITQVSPFASYLTQSSILLLSCLPQLLTNDYKSCMIPQNTSLHREALMEMRILIRNQVGQTIWYRQQNSSECLQLERGAEKAYSWMNIFCTDESPFFNLQFSLQDPKSCLDSSSSTWCDPCRIKETCVTGRFFDHQGFVWVCVELSGVQTLVTLRSSVIVQNNLPFDIQMKIIHGKAGGGKEVILEAGKKSLDKLKESEEMAQSHFDTHCIVLSEPSGCSFADADSWGYLMSDSILTASFSAVNETTMNIETNAWSESVILNARLPLEFELVKQHVSQEEENENAFRDEKASFISILNLPSMNNSTLYCWLMVKRVKCKTILPNDFELNQINKRYTWLEVSLWPVFKIANHLNFITSVQLTQNENNQSQFIEFNEEQERITTRMNPFTDIQMRINVTNDNPLELTISPLLSDKAQQKRRISHVVEGSSVSAILKAFDRQREPTIHISLLSKVVIENFSSENLICEIRGSEETFTHMFRLDQGKKEFLRENIIGNYMSIRLAVLRDAQVITALPEWSLQVILNRSEIGSMKECFASLLDTDQRLVKAFNVLLKNPSTEQLQICIYPRIVVRNICDINLKVVAVDKQGSFLPKEENSQELNGKLDQSYTPVMKIEMDTNDSVPTPRGSRLSSWFSLRNNSRGINYAKDGEGNASPVSAVQKSPSNCLLTVSILAEGFSWTEAISIKLSSTDFLQEKSTTQSQKSQGNDKNGGGLYVGKISPRTPRYRILVPHCKNRHQMLTYVIVWSNNSINVLFFQDPQPPLVIHNLWHCPLLVRLEPLQNRGKNSTEVQTIGGNHYMEYDWSLLDQEVPTEEIKVEVDSLAPSNKEFRISQSTKVIDRVKSHSRASSTQHSSSLRFQIGLPNIGWSTTLWQVGGIQFAAFSKKEAKIQTVFLATISYRAGTWYISLDCVEGNRGASLPSPSLAWSKEMQMKKVSIKIGFVFERIFLHFCDEFVPQTIVTKKSEGVHQNSWKKKNLTFLYPEAFRISGERLVVAYTHSSKEQDIPQALHNQANLGYLSHVDAFTTLYISLLDLEMDHFFEECNFPVFLSFPSFQKRSIDSRISPFLQLEEKQYLDSQFQFLRQLLDKAIRENSLPHQEENAIAGRVIFVQTRKCSENSKELPNYIHKIELKTAPAAIEIEDRLLTHVHEFAVPILDAVSTQRMKLIKRNVSRDEENTLEELLVCVQQKIFIEHLEISSISLNVTARASIPILNSFDGTPFSFASIEMKDVFAFPDQLMKDLAANYVADTIVRSPLILLSLNIIGNPAGFIRRMGTGVRDLVFIPIEATRVGGYNPWALSKGILGGATSFAKHTSMAALQSISGFSYSISQTVEQLVLPPDQLKKKHYTRPIHFASGVTSGLGSLGSSVVGAATGIVTTPLSIYQERRRHGQEVGVRDVVGGVGKGLVGIVARPVAGIASLVSLASDGMLHGINARGISGENIFFMPFEAKPNEVLRYKLKVISGVSGKIVNAGGIWVNPRQEIVDACPSSNHLLDAEVTKILTANDINMPIMAVMLVLSKSFLYIVGDRVDQEDTVLLKLSLLTIHGIEESLLEPTRLDLSVRTLTENRTGLEWYCFRLPSCDRRKLSHQLRTWLAETQR